MERLFERETKSANVSIHYRKNPFLTHHFKIDPIFCTVPKTTIRSLLKTLSFISDTQRKVFKTLPTTTKWWLFFHAKILDHWFSFFGHHTSLWKVFDALSKISYRIDRTDKNDFQKKYINTNRLPPLQWKM